MVAVKRSVTSTCTHSHTHTLAHVHTYTHTHTKYTLSHTYTIAHTRIVCHGKPSRRPELGKGILRACFAHINTTVVHGVRMKNVDTALRHRRISESNERHNITIKQHTSATIHRSSPYRVPAQPYRVIPIRRRKPVIMKLVRTYE